MRTDERTAFELTEAIPVGTYTMVLGPGDALARFSFMSQRFLQLTGLHRDLAMRDTMKAFECVHPEDRARWVELNEEAFAAKTPFFGQTRVVVEGKVRWITAESLPRSLPDGTIVWEGVLIDVTDRVLAEQELLRAKEAAEAANQALLQANLELQRLATTDRLTGLGNRLAFEAAMKRETERMLRHSVPLCMLLLDIDHFKTVNDRFGHQAGDSVLVETGACLRDELRSIDSIARWGGEEFAVLLPHCDLPHAMEVAERLRTAVAQRPFERVGRITVSIGVTRFTPGESGDTVLRRVDEALYASKQGGRNRTSAR